MNLEELQKEELEIRAALIKNNQAQLEINKKAFIEKWGFKVGDEVKYESRGKLIFAIIAGIECNSKNVEGYYVNPQSKNGKTYQQRTSKIYTWNLETMKKI